MNLDKEKYLKVRMSQGQGARTIDELKNMTDIVIENDTELNEIENLLKKFLTNASKRVKIKLR